MYRSILTSKIVWNHRPKCFLNNERWKVGNSHQESWMSGERAFWHVYSLCLMVVCVEHAYCLIDLRIFQNMVHLWSFSKTRENYWLKPKEPWNDQCAWTSRVPQMCCSNGRGFYITMNILNQELMVEYLKKKEGKPSKKHFAINYWCNSSLW